MYRRLARLLKWWRLVGFAMAACLALVCLARPGSRPQAAEPSDPAANPHGSARLVDGGRIGGDAGAPGGLLAGVEIDLEPDYITYWRDPGDAGVPPRFDFSGSSNVKDVAVEYPAPLRMNEAGLVANGYRDRVVFPLRVAPRDPTAPVVLHLTIDYAVCSHICLPARAELRLALDGSAPSGTEAQVVRLALAQVPRVKSLGEAGPLRIDGLSRAGPNALLVEATTPDGAGILFAEAPEPLYYSVSEARPARDGHVGFVLTNTTSQVGAPGTSLRLTLVAQGEAIEVQVRLDAVAAKP